MENLSQKIEKLSIENKVNCRKCKIEFNGTTLSDFDNYYCKSCLVILKKTGFFYCCMCDTLSFKDNVFDKDFLICNECYSREGFFDDQ